MTPNAKVAITTLPLSNSSGGAPRRDSAKVAILIARGKLGMSLALAVTRNYSYGKNVRAEELTLEATPPGNNVHIIICTSACAYA